MLIRGDIEMSEECPYGFKTLKVDDDLKIHHLILNINSEHAFLYDSIMSFIQQVAASALESLHDQITTQVIDELNLGFDRRSGTLKLIGKSDIAQDDRFLDVMRFTDEYLTMTQAGYHCVKDFDSRHCWGKYFTGENTTVPHVINNHDIQIYHHLQEFRSWFGLVFDKMNKQFVGSSG